MNVFLTYVANTKGANVLLPEQRISNGCLVKLFSGDVLLGQCYNYYLGQK